MLKASCKKINITPPVGLRMSGYEERQHGSLGIKDHLYASVLVLDDSQNKVVLVTVDTIGVDKPFMKYVRRVVSEHTDISPNAILVNASHTHSGPEAARFGDLGAISRRIEPTEIDEAYYKLMMDSVANGIIWANNELEPARIGFGQGHVEGLGSNRTDMTRYVDNTVSVMKVERLDESLISIVAFYACHPTVLNQDNYYYSGDFVSYYRRAIEKKYSDSVAMFVQGAAGNISTRHTRRSQNFDEAQRLGELLAKEVTSVASQVKTVKDIQLVFKIRKLDLQARKFDSTEICELKIKKAENKMNRFKIENVSKNVQRTAYVEWQGAVRNYRFKKMIDFEEIETEMQLIEIGDWSIITTPGEIFSETGQKIRQINPKKNIIVTGYTNGSVGYIPDLESIKELSGYETSASLVSEESEFLIIEVAKKLLDK